MNTDPILKKMNEEDPIVMYFVVRESLEMSKGKVAAQCAHAAQMIVLKYVQEICKTNTEASNVFYLWLHSSFRKVVLKADEKEWGKLKKLSEMQEIVVDAGLTEVKPNSETVMVFWPVAKSRANKLIKKLQVLK